MITLKVTSRFMFKNGDYLVTITKGVLKTEFYKKAVAESTFRAMFSSNIKCEYDKDRTITQKLKGKKEEEILEIVEGELKSAMSRKFPGQKLKYLVTYGI